MEHFIYICITKPSSSILVPVVFMILEDNILWFLNKKQSLLASASRLVGKRFNEIEMAKSDIGNFRFIEKSSSSGANFTLVGYKSINSTLSTVLGKQDNTYLQYTVTPYKLLVYLFPFDVNNPYAALPIDG